MDPAEHAYKFCPRCAATMTWAADAGRQRPRCPACGYIQYLNPAPAAGVVLLREDRICLVKRKYPPRQGKWSLPAGFVEFDEDIEATAVREVKEETNLDVRLDGLFAVHTGILPPNFPVLLVIYRAVEVGGEPRAGDDAAQVGFFPLDDLPGEIAFAVHVKVLAAVRAEQGEKEQ